MSQRQAVENQISRAAIEYLVLKQQQHTSPGWQESKEPTNYRIRRAALWPFFLKLAKNCCNPLVSQAQEKALTETVLEFATSSLVSDNG